MTFFQKHKLVLILSLVAVLLTGLVLGFVLGKNIDTLQELFVKKDLYRASCSIYIDTASDSSLNSSDLSVSAQILDSVTAVFDATRPGIQQAFPDSAFDLTLKQAEGTSIFYIQATCEDPQQAAEICNTAARLFSEKLDVALDGYSCKLIDRANIPTAPIE